MLNRKRTIKRIEVTRTTNLDNLIYNMIYLAT